MSDLPGFGALLARLDTQRHVTVTGAAGSVVSLLAGALVRARGVPVLLITAHGDEADQAASELRSAGLPVHHLPALEVLPGESGLSLDLLAQRLTVVHALQDTSQAPFVLAASIQSVMQKVPDSDTLSRVCLPLRRGLPLRLEELVRWLTEAGYTRVQAVEEVGEFAVRGGIVDVFLPGDAPPLRVDFFGDEIDALCEIDPDTMGSDRAVDAASIIAVDERTVRDSARLCVVELLPPRTVTVASETLEIAEQGRGYYQRAIDASGLVGHREALALAAQRCAAVVEVATYGPLDRREAVDLACGPPPDLPDDAAQAIAVLRDLARTAAVYVPCATPAELARLNELLDQTGSVPQRLHAEHALVWRGFSCGRGGPHVIPYHELLHRFHPPRTRRLRSARAIDTFLEFAPGDYVVHAEHGIARFVGLATLTPARAAGQRAEPEEFLVLEFARRARLNVPALQIDQVQRYVGGTRGTPPLSTLGGQAWKRQKDRVFESVRGLAAELLRVRAAREAVPGIRYPPDTPWQREFEAEFPYEETEDQLAALAAIKRDMERDRPMDRLICGDVGFGKTELAVRAAFKAVEAGKQVAVLVPTTVLAEQHEQTFRQRLADYPFRVESISRFKTDAETARILDDLRGGRVDVIIGTHRLLSADVAFADLGLVIIDEEQRFGVEHKERLLHLRLAADVLTLSATPIPRTLHMSLLGLRDISSLATPPADRQAVVTEVLPWDEARIRRAIERELARGGQVYYVHNRVHDIRSVADDLARIVPDARIVVGHGQMRPGELEDVMLRFTRRQADVLVCTTIIESGIDIPTANTIIICDADRFGLSDLHQLRGRVGRYRHRAYCYLLLPTDRQVTDKARRRLRAIEQFSMLGAGFKIAMRDLELRGAGNLLGPEQSGHIAAVGYDMYCRLLERAARTLRGEQTPEPHRTVVEIGVPAVIPAPYIPSVQRRMDAYRRVAQADSLDSLRRVRRDIESAYGPPPRQVLRLFDLAALRIAAAALGVRSITIRGTDVVLAASGARPVLDRLRGVAGTVRVPTTGGPTDLAEIYFRPPKAYLEPDTLLAVLLKRLADSDEPVSTQPTRSSPSAAATGTGPGTTRHAPGA